MDAGGDIIKVNEQISRIPTSFTGLGSHGPATSAGQEGSIDVQKLVSEAKREKLNVRAVDAELRVEKGSPLDKLWDLLGSGLSHIADPSKDACRILGSTRLNRVSGSMHITSFGHGYGGVHTDHQLLNFTHRIDRLQYGLDYPGLVNPLDGVSQKAQMAFSAFTYYVNVVPTIYVDRSQNAILTSQYAVTEFQKNFRLDESNIFAPPPNLVPGIFFQYDVEPILVRITESTVSFLTFLVRVGGVVGGIWATVRMGVNVMRVLSSFGPKHEGFTMKE